MRRVAFDVDGTLIDARGNWNAEVVEFARSITDTGGLVYVWSGGGVGYAENIRQRLLASGVPVVKAFGKSQLPEVVEEGIDEFVDDMPGQLGALESMGLVARVWLVRGGQVVQVAE